MRKVYSLQCDLDTLCAIGGGIAEEYYRSIDLNVDGILKEYLDEKLYGIVIL